jgi:hypothetical protein
LVFANVVEKFDTGDGNFCSSESFEAEHGTGLVWQPLHRDGAQSEINGPAFPVNGSVKILPDTADLDIGLSTRQESPDWAGKTVPAALEFRRKTLDPAQDRLRARDRPRSAIISTRSRKLSLKRRYHRTHRTMISRSKCRPLKSSSRPTRDFPISAILCRHQTHSIDRHKFAPKPATERFPSGRAIAKFFRSQ